MGRTTVCSTAVSVQTPVAGESPQSLFYTLDRQDRIIDVGGAWDDFALDNDGGSVLRAHVLGTQVFEHVNGDVSVMYLRTLLSSVRLLGRAVTRSYRCDSPGTKRLMEMTLTPDEDDAMVIAHRLLRTEALPARFVFTVDKGRPSFAVRCSMCNRLKKSKVWQEPEVVWRHDRWQEAGPTSVIYGICPDCMSGLQQHG